MSRELYYECDARSFDSIIRRDIEVTDEDIKSLCEQMKEVAIANCKSNLQRSAVKDVTKNVLLSWGILKKDENEKKIIKEKITVISVFNTSENEAYYINLKEKNSINKENYDLIQIYFILLVTQFLQWLSYNCTFKEISKYYDEFFGWIKEHFPKYKKVKYWKLTKGDRLKIRLIIATMMISNKLHLGKIAVFIYGKLFY